MPTTYTFSQPTGQRGRPRHLSFASLGEAATQLKVSIATLQNLVYLKQVQSHGVRFVSKTRVARAVNASQVGRNPNPLPVRLQHLDTGEVIEAPSIVAFCRKARFRSKHAAFHISPVLNQQRLSYRRWTLPEVANAPLPLKDVFGNAYTKTVGEWIKHLGAYTLNRLRAGRAVGALAPVAHSFGEVLPVKTHNVVSYTFRKGYSRGVGRPSVTATTLAEAAAKLGISAISAFELAHGYRPSVKGATFVGAKVEARRVLDVA